MISLNKNTNEHVIKVKIIDDPEYNPDMDFTIEICSEDGKRLEGDDTVTRVTIKDEDAPGTIAFAERQI